MNSDAELHDLLAGLFLYPREGYRDRFERCRGALAAAEPEAAGLLVAFAEQTKALSTEGLEELFTSTFDLNPACSLEVGWHLFGEQYARGAFLVKLRQEMRRLGLQESSELPDHLTHVLAVLGRMEQEKAGEFANACVLPAVEKMLAGLAGKNNPYEHVLKAVRCVVHARHSAVRISDAI